MNEITLNLNTTQAHALQFALQLGWAELRRRETRCIRRPKCPEYRAHLKSVLRLLESIDAEVHSQLWAIERKGPQ